MIGAALDDDSGSATALLEVSDLKVSYGVGDRSV
jgi:hypothetical protein